MVTNETKLQILLVDRDNDFRTNVCSYLQTDACKLSAVATGEEAVELLKENAFDLLVTETTLPGIDGFNLIAHARSVYPGIVVIATSSSSIVQDAVRAMQAGAQDYLAKPFELADMRAAIDRALQRLRPAQHA